MLKQCGGIIVNTTSTLGLVDLPKRGKYTVSKNSAGECKLAWSSDNAYHCYENGRCDYDVCFYVPVDATLFFAFPAMT